jgi:uncharacterized protein (DUF2147 family)
MKKHIGALSLLMIWATPAVSADSVYGVWLRDGHNESLEFFDCDGKLCARETIATGAEPQMILRHAQPNGTNQWKGDLFNPENGKTYSGKISYSPPNKLTLTGCLIAFLCQSESWTRAPKASAPRGAK